MTHEQVLSDPRVLAGTHRPAKDKCVPGGWAARDAEKRKVSWARYGASDKGLDRHARYDASDKGLDRRARYDASDKGMIRSVKTRAKQRKGT